MESKRACYARESEQVNQEIEALTRELEEVKEELKSVQKGQEIDNADMQSRLQVTDKLRRTIEQLRAASEGKPVHRPPPSLSSSRAGARKRPRLTRTLSQRPSRPTMPREVIWVDSESEGEDGEYLSLGRNEPISQIAYLRPVARPLAARGAASMCLSIACPEGST